VLPRLRHTAARSTRACSLMDGGIARGRMATRGAGRGGADGGIPKRDVDQTPVGLVER
jgi:hypothetical protein